MKTKILMVVPYYPDPVVGGLQKQSRELSRNLVDAGWNVCVVSNTFDSDQKPHETVEGIEIRRMRRLVPINSVQRLIDSIYSACVILFNRDAKIVHVHNLSFIGAFCAYVAELSGKRALVKIPNVKEHGLGGLRRTRIGRLALAMYRRASGFAVLSESSSLELQELGIPIEKIFLTPNGISNIPDAPADLVERDEVVFGFLGRLEPQKGLFDLLNAWAAVCQAFLNKKLILRIGGEGSQQQEIEDRARELQLTESVEFVGFIAKPIEFMADLDVFVLPSYAEGNSNSVLEAMVAGRPVISTDVGGTAMLLGDACAPYVLEPGDVLGLVSAMQCFIVNPELKAEVGRHNWERVSSKFSIKAARVRYEETYRKLLKLTD
jgi:glycosyltransferase involved in cell wall biosynthesis